jgi:hypothetical protein
MFIMRASLQFYIFRLVSFPVSSITWIQFWLSSVKYSLSFSSISHRPILRLSSLTSRILKMGIVAFYFLLKIDCKAFYNFRSDSLTCSNLLRFSSGRNSSKILISICSRLPCFSSSPSMIYASPSS